MTDMAMAAGRAYGQAPRWLQVLIVCSLGLNFIFLGLAAGAVWRGPPPPAPSIAPNLLGFASTLPPDRRKALWDSTEAERLHLRPFRRDVRAAREETIKTLMEEQFDKQKFIKAQAQQAEAETRARGAIQDLYGKIASGMTIMERREFQRWREARRPPGTNLLDESDEQKHGKAK
jgi:uncharacterized membrane protein